MNTAPQIPSTSIAGRSHCHGSSRSTATISSTESAVSTIIGASTGPW
jgi:hypothetical protein